MLESGRHGRPLCLKVIVLLKLGWSDIAEDAHEAPIVEPVDPGQGREFHVLCIAPGASSVHDFGLVKANDGLGERVVVGVSDAAYGRLDARFGEPFGVAHREVLNATVAVVDEPRGMSPDPSLNRLLKGIECEIGSE